MFVQLSLHSQLIFLSRVAPATYYNLVIHNNNIKVLCCVHVHVCVRMGERMRKYVYNCACSNFIEFSSRSYGICIRTDFNFIANQFVQLNLCLIESVEVILHIIDGYVVL